MKISLFVLVGMAMTLSACNTISDPPQPLPTISSPSPAAQPSQTRSQNYSAGNTAKRPTQEKRESYKPISLTKIGQSDALVGNDPKAIALSAFDDIESEGSSPSVTVDYAQPNQAIVTITQTGVADDSVGGIKYRVEFQQKPSAPTSQQWQMVWAGSQVKCHPGRGHQDWSTELCL